MRKGIASLLWILSGEDYRIINQCHKKSRILFGFIGLFVLLIFLLCFVSSYFSFLKIFDNNIIGIPLGLFFAWMLTNIYLLLLYTLAKDVLPNNHNPKARIFSLTLRLALVTFIAVIMSKPLEILIFQNLLEQDIIEFKVNKLEKYTTLTESYYDSEIQKINNTVTGLKTLNSNTSEKELKYYQFLIQQKTNAKSVALKEMERRINHSTYYVQSLIVLINKYPRSWFITLLVILLFLTPALTKNIVAKESMFNKRKRIIHTRMIDSHYLLFKILYEQALQKYSDLDKVKFTYQEKWLNPPYNTNPKKKPKRYQQEDLKTLIYSE